ncbi:hypothetical protein TTHERM_00756340 (macronuclear) [Tetrahymena thermophila SB210]|uniref:Uncharacterized protein n=1 Tax=Tetrahymena thermophila (strain SB210) TaxID=312017 RepID=I7MFP0_TETTS|nr:hypothetical protein TTHERM_00756340 [Tetrahymena thermophila SB210]EAR84086.2 hypothetical protein TTHERM_00756340 [Tetrahymena thermophila SB210]|eukprot:XP_001031749.2 hypothetical protein TTHERM_00756340 [Tetrahymena thermophila SB210]
MSCLTEDQKRDQMNQIIAERAYQAIKEITPQMEQDIRNEIRMRYEQELLEYKIAMEEKIKQNCQKEIEERVELMHKQTIEEFKRRKKNIEMKERELQNHKQKLQMLFEPEIQAREEQNFKVEKERIMTELLQNIDKNQLVNEVETELKKDIIKELNVEKESELKRKETIMRLNYKKKYENERAHLEEQMKYNYDNELQKELESIQLQRQMIQSQTQDKHNRIQNLQNEKKQQQLMIQKSKEKFQQMILDLEKELLDLNKFREQVQQEYAAQAPSSTFRRGNSSRHTSPQQTSKIVMSVNQPPLTSTSSQQQQIASSFPNQTSPSMPATSTKKRQSIQFQQDHEHQNPSSRKASPNNRLQNGYTTSQSSINQIKSKEEVSSQQAQNYLSEQQNTVVEDYQFAQPHQKLDTFNPSETQLHTEGDLRDRYKISQDSILNTEPNEQQKAKDIKERVTNLLGEIQQNYNTDLKEDIQNFIMQAEKNTSIQKKFQSLPTYVNNQNFENRKSFEEQQQQSNQEIQLVQQSETIQYKPSFHLLRKDSSETENSQNSHNQQSQEQIHKEQPTISQDTFRNLKHQYDQIKKLNEQQQQQIQGLPTFKTEPNSLRCNTVGNNLDHYYGSDQKFNQYQYETDFNKRGSQHNQNYKESMSGEDEYNQNNIHINRNQQMITNPSNGWYTSQENEYQTEEDQHEDSILNSSSSTVQLQKELRNPERVRPKEIQTEEEMINYILQEKSFPNKKQYYLLWKIRSKDSEEDKAIKNIKLTIDCILEEEKEYEPIYEQKVKQFEKEIDSNVKRFSEESWTEDDQYQKGSLIKEKFGKLKYFWKLCDTSFKERIQIISKFTSLFCMMNKLEKEIEDQVDIMDIVRNNPIIVKIGQQLRERQKIREKMINEFCLINYKNHKEDLKMVQEQINMLNNEYQQSDKKGKKTTHARLSRNKNNPKQLFWRNIKISDVNNLLKILIKLFKINIRYQKLISGKNQNCNSAQLNQNYKDSNELIYLFIHQINSLYYQLIFKFHSFMQIIIFHINQISIQKLSKKFQFIKIFFFNVQTELYNRMLDQINSKICQIFPKTKNLIEQKITNS